MQTPVASGFGSAATSKLFAREGARVVVAARRQRELDVLVEEIVRAGGQALALAGDVQDEAYAKGVVELAMRSFGGLDVAFNNAGTLGTLDPSTDMSVSEWESTLRTNLTSAFLAAKRQVAAMLNRGGGSVIFTSTFVGYTAAFPNMTLRASRA